jgi:hypothetical protein
METFGTTPLTITWRVALDPSTTVTWDATAATVGLPTGMNINGYMYM